MFADQAQSTETPAVPAEPTQAPAVTQPTDAYGDLLKGITTEDGRPKYGTVSDALNSIPAAQQHIRTLETELAELRAKQNEENKVDKVLEELNALKAPKEDQPKGIEESDVAKIVQQLLSQNQSENLAKTNQKTVVDKLTEMYGAEAENKFEAKAKELGVTAEFLEDIAAKSPAAVLGYFPAPEADLTKTTGGINTTAMEPAKPEVKTNIMGGASTDDILALWKASAPN